MRSHAPQNQIPPPARLRNHTLFSRRVDDDIVRYFHYPGTHHPRRRQHVGSPGMVSMLYLQRVEISLHAHVQLVHFKVRASRRVLSAIRSRSPRSPVTKLLLERSPRSSSEASSAAPSEEIWPPDSPGEKLPIISPWRKVMMPEAVSSFNFERNFLASSLLFFFYPFFFISLSVLSEE